MGVSLTEAAPEDAREPNDFARVIEGPSVASTPDPVDDFAYVTTLDVRLSWSRSISVGFPQPLAENVSATPKIVGG